MPTPSFPLFRLPYVVLKEVLSETGPKEIFILSICSRKSNRIIKFIKLRSQNLKIFFHWNSIGIEFDNDTKYSVLLRIKIVNTTNAPKDQSTFQFINIGNFKAQMGNMVNNALDTYWDDEAVGMQQMSIYFTEIFHRPISKLAIGDENGEIPEDSKWIVDWINTRQKSVEELHYQTNEANAEDVSYVFSNLKVDNSMLAILTFPDQLIHPNIKIPPMSVDFVEISGAYWMTLEHIFAFDCCEEGTFHTTNFSSQDLNTLLRHLTNGRFTRLKVFDVETQDVFNYETVLEGVEFKQVPQNVVRQYDNGWRMKQIRGGFDITRKSDGLMMTLIEYANPRWFELIITSKLEVL